MAVAISFIKHPFIDRFSTFFLKKLRISIFRRKDIIKSY